MGGLIAFEMAQQLKGLGKEVALLALLDAWGPHYPRPTSSLTRFVDQVRAFRALPSWAMRLARLRKKFTRCLRRAWTDPPYFVPPHYHVLAGTARGTLVTTIKRVMRANARANDAYQPRPYDGTIVLLRAHNPDHWCGMRFDDLHNGWSPLFALRGIRTLQLPYNHHELVVEPPAAVGQVLQAKSTAPARRRSTWRDMHGERRCGVLVSLNPLDLPRLAAHLTVQGSITLRSQLTVF